MVIGTRRYIGPCAFLVGTLLAAACSGNRVTPPANPTEPGNPPAKHGHGAFFVPVVPPFSPNTPYTRHTDRRTGAMTLGLASPVSDHWFYLVNGYQLQTPVPGQPASAPVPQTTPYALTVSGPLPAGAPGPNGGVTVGTVYIGSATQVNQLWKLVPVTPGSTSKNQRFYLRSAQSFLPLQPQAGPTPMPTINPNGNVFPSMLTGFGTQAINLDLGTIGGATPAVYLNQNTAPFQSGATSFQQWYYDTANQSINNGNGGALVQSCPPTTGQGCVGMGQGGSGPTSRWYAYPNYALSVVLAEPTSGPAFPQPSTTTAPNGSGTTDVKGEIAAYYYITSQAIPGQAINAHQCTIPGEPGSGPYNTTYGIRCLYTQPASVNLLNTCTNAAEAQNPPSSPQPYNPNNTSMTATITAADWNVVGFQLAQECTYAGSTLSVYGVYQTVLDNIFTLSSGDIENLADLIGTTHTVNLAPTTLLEGIVYTILSAGSTYAGGNKGLLGGIFANLLQTTVDYAQARPSKSPLNTTLAVTSQTLYTKMGNQMQAATAQMGTQVQDIVWSWQRLKQAGPLMTQDGPNGLDLTFQDEASVTATGVAAYETMFLQTFYPEVYALQFQPGQNHTTGFSAASYNTYTYPTFGSSAGSWNASFLCQLTSATKDCPNASLMASPEPLPAQSRFALFNGMNGWSSLPRTSPTMDFNGAMVVLFNGTPNTLTVKVSTLTGIIASPGQNFVNGWGQCCISGSGNPYSAQLLAYGYVPIYGATNGAGQYIFYVNAYSGGLPVAQLEIENAYPAGTKTPWVMTASLVRSPASGWSLYPSSGQYTQGSANVQEPIMTKKGKAQQSTPATMWLVIQQ